MAGELEGLIQRASAVSTAALHPEPQPETLIVGPSTENEFNTLRARLTPKACFKLEDSNFEFDSSFITVLTFDAGPLKDLLDKHPGSKLSIFGHADPAGRDDYNKMLSGRRAQAIFGLLVRRVDLWEDLYFNHDTFSGKDEWGVRAIKLMLNQVGPTKTGITKELDAQSKQALKDFEQKEGLPLKGFNSKKEVAPETFRKLTSLYMDFICTDDESKDFRLKPEDFLARGQGKDGKGDFQGCGEFNPLMIFSKDEKTFFDREENHRQRNTENQTNRRVMILLFRPRSQVDPEKWPCPSAKQGIEGCRKRFFVGGEKRRSNQAERRELQKTKDTFACRFYDQLANSSPCERTLRSFDIRLYDPDGIVIPDAPFVVTIGGRKPAKGVAKDGFVRLQDVEVPAGCVMEWGLPPKDGAEPELSFRLEMFLDVEENDADREAEATQRLHNLGYPASFELQRNVAEFQRDFGQERQPPLRADGVLDDDTIGRLRDIYRRSDDDLGQRRK